MKKINVIGVSIIAVTLGGCASEPMRDVTYLPKATSPQPTQYYNSKGEIYIMTKRDGKLYKIAGAKMQL